MQEIQVMKKISLLIKDDRGAISVLTVIMIIAFIGILAVVIDLGHLHSVQSELRNAADACALAGARALMPLSDPSNTGKEPPWPMEDPPPCSTAIQIAIETGPMNKADLKNDITLDPGEVLTGNWDFKPVEIDGKKRGGTFTPKACGSDTNAVKVTARMRGDLSQGSVFMTFGKIFIGDKPVNPSVEAVAAIGFLQTLPKDSKGGFIAADHDFLLKAWQNWKNGNTEQKYYIVLGPAGGQTSYQYADNGGWTLPSGGYKNFNPTLNNYIDNLTQVDISVGDYVDLKNGEMSNAVKNLQGEVQAAGNALTITIEGVYADALGASVGDAWNEKSTRLDSFFEVQLTNVWKANEFKKDPAIESIINQMYPDLNAQNKIVGVIELKMLGPMGLGGEGGAGLPSNTFGFKVKLVE